MNGEETIQVVRRPKPKPRPIGQSHPARGVVLALGDPRVPVHHGNDRAGPRDSLGSMENTLLVGDHLLMSRFGYDAEVPMTQLHVRLWREPHRQQIVVFRAPLPGNSGLHQAPDRIAGRRAGNSRRRCLHQRQETR